MTEESDLLFRPGVRLAVDYFLESADRIVRTLDEDLGPSVVFLAAVWANVANQAAAFAATGEPPDPDAAERRMPVTVLRLSQSLGLPFETVRRYASRLGASGYCQRQSGGLVVQGEIFQRPAFDACLDQTWAATARLARDLEAVGVVLPPPSGDKTSEARRWVARLSARHFLRGLDLITRALEQDFLSCLVFLAINRANTSMLFEDAALARAYAAPDTLREDALRRPAPVIEIARALRLPYETTRRRALLLVEAGLCERLEGGLVAPAAVLASPRVTPAMLEAWRLTYAFMISSRRLGVA